MQATRGPDLSAWWCLWGGLTPEVGGTTTS